MCSQVRLPTFCFAYQRNIAIFIDHHVRAGREIQNIRWYWQNTKRVCE